MYLFEDQQRILQFDAHRGGYGYVIVPAYGVGTLPEGKKTRLLCTVDGKFTFQCGLNHLGDGNFYIILSTRNLKSMELVPGQTIHFGLQPDPDPLGVAMPEALAELLQQDEVAHKLFEQLTMGRKRYIIHAVSRYRNVDKLISTALSLIHQPATARGKKKG